MTHKTRAPVEAQRDAGVETNELSDVDLLAAIRRERLRVYAELLHESLPDRVAALVQRLEAESRTSDTDRVGP